MDGNLAPQVSTSSMPQEIVTTDLDLPSGGGGNLQYMTNVIRLARSVKPLAINGNKQIVFYQSGVGSEANFKGDPVSGTTLLQALGTAVASKIRDAYAFLAQNYEDGDEICIFGFSRGAYTARKLSGLIDVIGLLPRKELVQFFRIWRELVDGKTPTIPPDTRRPRIKCVGVWDTVGSVYGTIDALEIKDTSLPTTIDIALHAVSLQENRKKFLPTLWTSPPGGIGSGQVLKQVWFAGAHSDVGGGYQRHELADIALFWMAGEIQSFINLDLDFMRSTAQRAPDPWGTSQPHNAYMETPITQRMIVGHETRLESGQITTNPVFHESIKNSPKNLVSPDKMITLEIIAHSLPGFNPVYPPLNDFEKYCKDNWGKLPIGGPIKAPIFDSPEEVIRPPVNWVVGEHRGILPSDAIVGGREADGRTIYVARAPYAGGVHPGKATAEFVYISYDGKEILIRGDFQLLVGSQNSVRWVAVSGRYSHDLLNGAVPVRGGMEADGEPLFIAQAPISGGIHCGKVKVGGHAHIPFNYKEVFATTYNVLVFA